jgi:hypothetical protein
MNSHLLKQFDIADAHIDWPLLLVRIGPSIELIDALVPFAEVERDPLLSPVVIEFVGTKAPLGER